PTVCYVGDDLVFTQTRLRLIVPVPASLLGLQKILKAASSFPTYSPPGGSHPSIYESFQPVQS
ncbi:hypothetical protein AMECASPLE_029303, partial [Ameca splendens]